MTPIAKLISAFLVTAALGAVAVPLQAQSSQPAPAYVINEIEVTDQAGFATYAKRQGPLVEKFGGHFLSMKSAADQDPIFDKVELRARPVSRRSRIGEGYWAAEKRSRPAALRVRLSGRPRLRRTADLQEAQHPLRGAAVVCLSLCAVSAMLPPSA